MSNAKYENKYGVVNLKELEKNIFDHGGGKTVQDKGDHDHIVL